MLIIILGKKPTQSASSLASFALVDASWGSVLGVGTHITRANVSSSSSSSSRWHTIGSSNVNRGSSALSSSSSSSASLPAVAAWHCGHSPAADIPIRNICARAYRVETETEAAPSLTTALSAPSSSARTTTTLLLDTIDERRAFFLVHPGAVYLHRGRTFVIDAVDFHARIAHARASAVRFCLTISGCCCCCCCFVYACINIAR